MSLSVPPFSLWPLAWVGLAGLCLLLVGQHLAGRAALGMAAGLGQYALAVWWVTEFQSVGYVALVVLSALFTAAACALVPARRFRGVLVGLPAALTLAEWARDRYPLGGFPLGSVALGQAGSPLVAATRLGGSLGLTLITALAGAVVAALALTAAGAYRARTADHHGRPPGRRQRRAGVEPYRVEASLPLAGAAVVAAVVAAGLLVPAGGDRAGTIRVALVQGGGQRGTRAIYSDPDVVFNRQLTASASLRPPLNLVVWPEGMLQSHYNYRITNGAVDLSSLARRLGATVVAGVEQDVGKTRYLNEVVAWSPAGHIIGSYEKNHLVPFGEYIPMRSLVGRFFSLRLVPRDAIAGHGPGILNTPAGPLGVMISYEVFFDRRARVAVDAGGQVLVVPTNTASYSTSQVPAQELAAARLRAWETDRTVVQATPTGYSAVVGPEGQVRQRSTLGAPDVMVARVALHRGRTVYVRVGSLPVVLIALAALGASAAGEWRSGRMAAATAPDEAVPAR